jgi:hypothetical protein
LRIPFNSPLLPPGIRVFYWAGLCLVCTAFCWGQAKAQSQPNATVSAASSEARIVPPPAGYRFPNGRTYVFNVEWHFFNAGTATVKLEDSGPEERVTALANSAGVVNALYKVNDRFQAYFDPRTFCSLRIEKHTQEGSRKRETQVHFDYAKRKTVLDEKNLKNGESKHTENDVPGCVTDVISGFYYLASLPLQPGAVETFPINDGGKTTNVVARVEAREQIKVPAGTYQTVRVKSEAVSGPLKGKGTVWVWFTDDADHIPVQMRSKLGWGTLLFRMQRIE